MKALSNKLTVEIVSREGEKLGKEKSTGHGGQAANKSLIRSERLWGEREGARKRNELIWALFNLRHCDSSVSQSLSQTPFIVLLVWGKITEQSKNNNKRRENDLNIVHCRFLLYAGCRSRSLMLRSTATITNFFLTIKHSHWWLETNEFKLETLCVQINRRRQYGHASIEKITGNGKCDVKTFHSLSLLSSCVCVSETCAICEIDFQRSTQRWI